MDDLPTSGKVGFYGGIVGGAYIGITCLKHFIPELMDENATITAAQAIAAIGVPALSGLLGSAVGTILGVLAHDYEEEYGVLEDIGDAVADVAFGKIPHAIGNTAGKVSEKLGQIATALDQKAHQIAEKIKTKFQNKNKDNDNTLSR